MDDDFNTPLAMASIYELVKAINTARDEGAQAINSSSHKLLCVN
jgi:cysteinyl-tRNA synthetase